MLLQEVEASPYYRNNASFEEMVEAFGMLIKQGKVGEKGRMDLTDG